MSGAIILLAATACQLVEGGRIRARDLAAAVPVFAAAPPDTVLGWSPLPGLRRDFTRAELARLAKPWGTIAADTPPLCVQRSARPMTQEAIEAAMRKAFDSAPGLHITIADWSRYPVPEGELVFPRAALPAPTVDDARPVLWSGYVQHDAGRMAVWAKATITVTASRVVANEDLLPGHPITAAQVHLEQANVAPARAAGPASVDAVVGNLARHTIVHGAIITAAMLEPPYAVTAGDNVRVEVRSGAAVLHFDARVSASGRPGDMVAVRNPAGGHEFRARVVAKGALLVEVNR